MSMLSYIQYDCFIRGIIHIAVHVDGSVTCPFVTPHLILHLYVISCAIYYVTKMFPLMTLY